MTIKIKVIFTKALSHTKLHLYSYNFNFIIRHSNYSIIFEISTTLTVDTNHNAEVDEWTGTFFAYLLYKLSFVTIGICRVAGYRL